MNIVLSISDPTTGDVVWSILQVALPTIAAGAAALFAARTQARITSIEHAMERERGIFERKLDAHEQLWPLVAACVRAQEVVGRMKRDGGDLGGAGKRIADCRAAMKNFVYDKGLYFGEEVRRAVQELDTALADPRIDSVTTQARTLEEMLRRALGL